MASFGVPQYLHLPLPFDVISSALMYFHPCIGRHCLGVMYFSSPCVVTIGVYLWLHYKALLRSSSLDATFGSFPRIFMVGSHGYTHFQLGDERRRIGAACSRSACVDINASPRYTWFQPIHPAGLCCWEILQVTMRRLHGEQSVWCRDAVVSLAWLSPIGQMIVGNRLHYCSILLASKVLRLMLLPVWFTLKWDSFWLCNTFFIDVPFIS